MLENGLIQRLVGVVPNLDPNTLAGGGATTLRGMVSADKLSLVLDIYNDSIRSIWYLGLALSCLVLLTALGMEWKSVKKDTKKTENTEP